MFVWKEMQGPPFFQNLFDAYVVYFSDLHKRGILNI